jgi:hypothetical protein
VTTALLIVAALVVLALFAFCVHQMATDGLTACWYWFVGVPQGLCHVLGLLIAAIVENLGSSN